MEEELSKLEEAIKQSEGNEEWIIPLRNAKNIIDLIKNRRYCEANIRVLHLRDCISDVCDDWEKAPIQLRRLLDTADNLRFVLPYEDDCSASLYKRLTFGNY